MRTRTPLTLALSMMVVAGAVAVAASPDAIAAGGRAGMSAGGSSPVVRTEAGLLRGRLTPEHRVFEGVRYAAAPRGDLRWRAPRPVPAWHGIQAARAPGSPCPQVPSSYADVSSLEEDCLFLNVTAPRDARPSARKPVMVWIHGDGAVGAGSFFDPGRLAADGDVVAVTINYRLGVFGGFGLPGLAGSGTFGLQDQQAALRWVRRNIAAFGGDPHNVTVFGVSYGALATVAQLVSPSARGLFDRAIVESGFAMMDLPAEALFPGGEAQPWFGWRSVAETAEVGTWVAGQLGCDQAGPPAQLACLRALPVARILEFPQIMNIFQAIAYGGPVLPELPPQALRAGRFHRVPVISGATRDEHRLFVGLFRVLAGAPVTAAQYPELVIKAFGADRADAILRRYPLSEAESPSLTWASLLTDAMWARATTAQNEALAAAVPTFAYEFADRDAPMYLPFPPDFPAGAFHAGDTPYVLRDAGFSAAATPAQVRLSDQMIRYWSTFARTGNPNSPGLPRWSRYHRDRTRPTVLSLAPGRIRPVDYAAEHQLDLWSP